MVVLAVQLGGRLVRDAGAAGSASPRARPAIPPAPARPDGPGSRRSRRADALVEKISILPDGVAERMRHRIGAEGVEAAPCGSSGRRHLEHALRPERLERRQRRSRTRPRVSRERLVRDGAAMPCTSRPSVNVSLDAEPLGESRRRSRSRRAPRPAARPPASSRSCKRSRARGADVVALEHRGRGQHDVGVLRGGGPVRARARRSSRAGATRSISRFRSWWWWKGLPPPSRRGGCRDRRATAPS